ncbi:peroxiredoxin [Hyphomicrobium sp. D-2]|uniref:peroxiredoxin n=1 Tax=Hyphomicrobium sp. D-2 TaxID=3041621 RepID=UPI002458D847|nr:peroxiredoxin [Hyphomicrobium sp. D-2]MDH4982952.1 peroxiredoxin [Hyphomicrobium sp. D-2]
MAESTSNMSDADSGTANSDDAAVRHLISGVELPDVTLLSHRGEGVNLATRRGAAVVYVYPWTGRPGVSDPPGWDDIPGAHGSTPETEGFRDHYLKFRSQKIEVFGVSTQSDEHQQELAARLAVPFQLLSDEMFAFQRALALPTFQAGNELYLRRLTLFIRDGIIAHTFHPVERPGEHAREILDWLDEKRRVLNSGQI